MKHIEAYSVCMKKKADWINGLAAIYKKQGLAAGTTAKKIAEVTGLHRATIIIYLYDEFKQTEKTMPIPEPKITASANTNKG